MQVRKVTFEVIAVVVAAAVIGLGGILWANQQQLIQIQGDRYTSADGEADRARSDAGDRRLEDKITTLTIQLTRLVEHGNHGDKLMLRLESKLESVGKKIDLLTNEITSEFVRKDELNGYETGGRD